MAERPELGDAVLALLAARRAIAAEVAGLERRIKAAARQSAVCRWLMTVPGVGPMTALAFTAAIDRRPEALRGLL